MKEIRIICPSLSFKEEDKEQLVKNQEFLEKEGYLVSYGKYVFEKDDFYECATIKHRLADLYDAFSSPSVEAIICGKGGFNVNQLLPDLDFEIIRANPKIICGMSDLTALLLSIYEKTNMITYLGPNFLTCQEEFTRNNLLNILKRKKNLGLKGKNNFTPLQEGEVEGLLISGNLCTLNLLQGTPYFSKKKNVVLFIEDDDNYKKGAFFKEFDRNFESLLQSDLLEIKGILFGIFEKDTMMTKEKLKKLISLRPCLKDIPIAMNICFGHTVSITTLPIGKTVKLKINDQVRIEIKD